MKRYLLVVMLLVCSVALYAQQEVTRFLGIPVDGKKSVMIQKLKEKGFTNTPFDKDVLVGNFNGSKVNVFVVTNNDKVCRIVVYDAGHMSAGDIKIRFNTLCRQFQNNEKYLPASFSDYTLSEEEDISYEMAVHNKRYEAAFYQRSATTDTVGLSTVLLEKYTAEELAALIKEQREEVEAIFASYILDKCSNRLVWFMIEEYYGEYGIVMFYDNEYNKAHGEDL